MKIRRRVEIEIQTSNFALRGKQQINRCKRCGGKLTKVDQSAKAFFINYQQIFNLVENGAIHFTETAEGLLLICFSSLFNNHR
ncbi:MAG: hypothetical protein M3209_10145 [Acidobacteriota bacterium]|nr:hypothetical protein [Acidobacteriota bacterium]